MLGVERPAQGSQAHYTSGSTIVKPASSCTSSAFVTLAWIGPQRKGANGSLAPHGRHSYDRVPHEARHVGKGAVRPLARNTKSETRVSSSDATIASALVESGTRCFSPDGRYKLRF